ncbi:MAG TPA: ABC transporter permease subunit, partial [Acidimicrobiales bacterium]|nr:ABC transporter permease subunit [Acidimicrobiales bacterium]
MWDVVGSARVRELLWRTLLLSVTVTAGCAAIAVPVAWLTVRTDLPLRRFFAVVTALPLAIPTYVGGFALIAALGPRGTLQGWLEPFGVHSLPQLYGFRGAWLVLTLCSYPYVLLTVRSAIRHLDPSLEEASRMLGHGTWTTLFRVVLPQLRPALVAGSLLVALYTLADFGAVSMLRYDSFTRAIFLQYRASLDRSTAAVLGLVLVAVTVVVLSGETLTRGRAAYHGVHAGAGRPA